MELQEEGVQACLIQECAEEPCVLRTEVLFVFDINFPKRLLKDQQAIQ